MRRKTGGLQLRSKWSGFSCSQCTHITMYLCSHYLCSFNGNWWHAR
jgi:hypothetical protein